MGLAGREDRQKENQEEEERENKGSRMSGADTQPRSKSEVQQKTTEEGEKPEAEGGWDDLS